MNTAPTIPQAVAQVRQPNARTIMIRLAIADGALFRQLPAHWFASYGDGGRICTNILARLLANVCAMDGFFVSEIGVSLPLNRGLIALKVEGPATPLPHILAELERLQLARHCVIAEWDVELGDYRTLHPTGATFIFPAAELEAETAFLDALTAECTAIANCLQPPAIGGDPSAPTAGTP